MMSEKMYYEEYDDQSQSDFDYIGTGSNDPVPITDLVYQVNELRRIYGRSVPIMVYRSNAEVAI